MQGGIGVNVFSVPGLSFLLSGKVSPKEIEKIVEGLEISPADDLYAGESDPVNVAALQVQLRRYSTLDSYIQNMSSYVSDAVNRRTQLVCFPALAGLLPTTCLPQSQRYLEELRVSTPAELDASKLHRALSQLSDYIFDVYFQTMSALAARHRVYIMAGSALYFEQDGLVHRAFLFNHRGELVGFQDKAGLTDLEAELGIAPASEIRVFETPVGPLSILIGSDADYYETALIAKNLGAKILLCPAVFHGEYTPVQAALGLNMRVQETKLYGVQSTLCGDTGLGFSVEGGCAIFAPNELIRKKNGVVMRAGGGFSPEVVCASLSGDRLERIYNLYTQDKNPALMEAYVDRLY